MHLFILDTNLLIIQVQASLNMYQLFTQDKFYFTIISCISPRQTQEDMSYVIFRVKYVVFPFEKCIKFVISNRICYVTVLLINVSCHSVIHINAKHLKVFIILEVSIAH